MKNVLFLTGKNNSFYFFSDTKYGQLEYVDIYRSNIFCKFFRHINLLCGFSLGNWKYKLSNYDAIVCIDSIITLPVLKWIEKNKGNAKVKFCFRNKFVENNKRWTIDDIKKLDIEIWSYNMHDCDKYGFKYYNQFINLDSISSNKDEESIVETFDLVYIGANKNRHNDLLQIVSIAKNMNLIPFYYVIDDNELENNSCKKNEFMPYSDYISVAKRSNIIIDLVSAENNGLTLRPIEAMLLEKKLITNYKEIKKYDFYNSENIWILGEDDEKRLIDFIKYPYTKMSEEIIEKYTVNGWLRRIIGNEQY